MSHYILYFFSKNSFYNELNTIKKDFTKEQIIKFDSLKRFWKFGMK